jgi:hypothetical protein
MGKKMYYISVLFILFSLNLNAQCFCSEIKFRMYLPDIVITKHETNYSIRVIEAPEFITDVDQRRFNETEIENDSVKFEFRTASGIEKLIFTIKNDNTGKEMKVIVSHMDFDNPYMIDLTTFTPGTYAFNWTPIDACQHEHKFKELINCDGMIFYQLEINRKYIPVLNKIRPYDLNLFLVP